MSLTGVECCVLCCGIPLLSTQEESVPAQHARVVLVGGLAEGRQIGPV